MEFDHHRIYTINLFSFSDLIVHGNLRLTPETSIPSRLLEVVRGFDMLVRVLTRITSIPIIIEMITAIILTKISDEFIGGFELDLC
jgi:hypothetical protein